MFDFEFLVLGVNYNARSFGNYGNTYLGQH